MENIIWGYHTGSQGELKAYYPGDEYVDIIGHSVYHLHGNPELDFYDYDWAVAKKKQHAKIIWIPELGINSPDLPPRDCYDVLVRLEQDYPELAGMVWWSDTGMHNVTGNANGEAFARDERIISLDELPDWKAYR
ncbi:MAG: hypothetical protein HC819_13300 [Cyclobacteriaceae bacterium]|nr:hypothetical protein [Cyclobacteriaceae bacterium]